MDAADTPFPTYAATPDGMTLRFFRASEDIQYLIETTSDLNGVWTEWIRNPGHPGEEVFLPIPLGMDPLRFIRLRLE